NTSNLLFQQVTGEVRNWSEVKIREEYESIAEELSFLLDRLLDLYHHLRPPPDLRRRAQNLRAGLFVLVVRHRRQLACLRLDHHLVSCVHQCLDTRRHNSYSGFVIFYFFRNSDEHEPSFELKKICEI